MLFAGEGLFLVFLVLWLYTLLDVVTSYEAGVRNLPKTAWFFVVLLTMEIGVVLWWLAGRPQGGAADLPYKGNRSRGGQTRDRWPSIRTAGFPQNERPGAPTNPDDDDAYQAQLRRRIDEQRRRAEQQREDGA